MKLEADLRALFDAVAQGEISALCATAQAIQLVERYAEQNNAGIYEALLAQNRVIAAGLFDTVKLG